MKFRNVLLYGGMTKHIALIPTISIYLGRLSKWHQIDVTFRIINLYASIEFELTFELKKGGENGKIKG